MASDLRRFYTFRRFRLDPNERVLFEDDAPVPLTPRAIDTLIALVERHGHLVTKDELFRIVWPDTFVEENNLTQNISTLRRVLGGGADGRQFIETVPKRGYRFSAAVSERVEGHDGRVSARASDATPDASAVSDAARRRIPSARRLLTMTAIVAGIGLVTTALWWLVDRRSVESPFVASPTPIDRSRPTDLIRIAVLPFTNLGSPEEQYFAAGMTEEITSRLAGVSRLAVPSSTTINQYKREDKNLRRIGADLRVDYIVEGTVRWAGRGEGSIARITPRLIRVSDDTTIWTAQYESALADVFRMQAEIAREIARALQVALESGELHAFQARPTEDEEAYLAYLRGLTTFVQGVSDTGNQRVARENFERAVARDPGFALAWSLLARVYASSYNTGAQRTRQMRQAAHDAAERAIELDAGLPEGRLARAQILLGDRDYEGAMRELEIASRSLPNSPVVDRLIGTVEQRRGRWLESLAVFMRGFDVDPAYLADPIAIHYLHMRQYVEADRFISIGKAANISSIALPEAWSLFTGRGDLPGARRVLEAALASRNPEDGRARGLLARLEWLDGRHERALELIAGMDPAGAWLPANFRFPAALAAAQVYDTLGRRAEAAENYSAALTTLEQKRRVAADDYQIEAALGLTYAGLGRAPDAIRHGRRAVQLLPRTRDAAEGPLYLYLLAQVYTRVGRYADAVATLERMLSAPGFYNERWVERDPAFAPLRSDARYRERLVRLPPRSGVALLDGQAAASRR